MTSASIAQQFDRVVEDLTAEFAGALNSETVMTVINKYRGELEPEARITDFLPVLVRRYAREELKARSQHPIAV